MSNERKYTTRRANKWEDVVSIHMLLVDMHTEIGVAAMNSDKVMQRIANVVYDQAAFVTTDRDGVIIGTMGIEKCSLWYSDEESINDLWCYVAKESRGKMVLGQLLLAASRYAENQGVPFYFSQNNPDREAARGKRSVVAENFAIIPVGKVIKIG